MEPFLNLFGQFGEVNLGDCRFGFDHNAVGFDSANRGVFVFLAVQRREVVGQRE